MLGPNVNDISIGASVYGLSSFDRDGAAAEYMVISKEYLAPKPKTLDYIQAASIPLAALTAWQGLFEHGQLAKGQRVLIHGATGGVGNFAVQLAHQHGAYVIGTVSTMNIIATRRLEIDEVIDHTKTQFEEVVGKVDLVFDTVGGTLLEHSPSVLRLGGRLVSVASEPSQELAEAFGIKSIYFVVKPNGKELIELTNLVDSGKLQPSIDKVFPLAKARQAFERSLIRHGVGKIVLRIAND